MGQTVSQQWRTMEEEAVVGPTDCLIHLHRQRARASRKRRATGNWLRPVPFPFRRSSRVGRLYQHSFQSEGTVKPISHTSRPRAAQDESSLNVTRTTSRCILSSGVLPVMSENATFCSFFGRTTVLALKLPTIE